MMGIFSILISWEIRIDGNRKFRLDASMKTKRQFILALCLTLFYCTVLAADKEIEQSLRDLDAQWSKAGAAKDVDKTVSYYSDDAIVMPPNAAAATTKEAIRKTWKDVFDATVSGSWTATNVKAAKSGEMAYVSGTYEFTANDASGKPVTDKGKYVEVWKKQADGKWKCEADIWNSDLPASTAAVSETK
jgi:ketosteroid isomerase-like protein